MKNQLVNFIDWYLNLKDNEENKSDYYFTNNRDKFIEKMNSYSVEFAMAYGFNPFECPKNSIGTIIEKIESVLYPIKNKEFEEFNQKQSNGIPRAILGKKNYLKFLAEWQDFEDFSDTEMEEEMPTSSTIYEVFTQEELRKNFRFRLMTQDRFYDDFVFPISLLAQIFTKNNRRNQFLKLLDKQIDAIILHIGQNASIQFKDLRFLAFDADHKIIVNGTDFLYSETINADNSVEMQQTIAPRLRNIAIDHIVPFKELYLELAPKLPKLQELHKKLTNKYSTKLDKNTLKGDNNFIESFTKEDVVAFEEELNLLFDKIKLQLMTQTENLKKRRL